MTIAKLNDRFDYITLRIKFADGRKLNLTHSRRGETASGTAANREVLEFFSGWMRANSKRPIGDLMRELQSKAQRSATVHEFIKAA